MVGTPWLPALFLALVPAAAFAAPPATPATAEPHSTAWPPHFKERIEGIFKKVLGASGYDGEHWRREDAKAWTGKKMREPTQLRYTDKFRFVEGSPALAVAARTGPNREDYSMVVITFGVLEFTDEDQLAFILAHEMAHLALRHPEQMEENKRRLFDPWYEANAARASGMTPAQVAEAFIRDAAPRLAELQKPLEKEADADGLNLTEAAGYDRSQAARALQRAQDWLWAQGESGKEDKTHDPLEARAKRLQDWDRAMGKAEESARRLKP